MNKIFTFVFCIGLASCSREKTLETNAMSFSVKWPGSSTYSLQNESDIFHAWVVGKPLPESTETEVAPSKLPIDKENAEVELEVYLGKTKFTALLASTPKSLTTSCSDESSMKSVKLSRAVKEMEVRPNTQTISIEFENWQEAPMVDVGIVGKAGLGTGKLIELFTGAHITDPCKKSSITINLDSKVTTQIPYLSGVDFGIRTADGKIYPLKILSAKTTFLEFKNNQFIASDDSADFDEDGISNAEEIAKGTDPLGNKAKSGAGALALKITQQPDAIQYLQTGTFTVSISNTSKTKIKKLSYTQPILGWSAAETTCGSEIEAEQSCTQKFNYTFNGSGIKTFPVTFSAEGVTSQTVTLDASEKPMSITVSPFFDGVNTSANAQDWGQMVIRTSNPFAATTACISTTPGYYGDCANGGLWKRVSLPGISSCSDLNITESGTAWFDWNCTEISGNAVFYSTGLKDSVRISDLIDTTNAPASYAWLTKSVTITKTGNPIAASESTTLWSNSVLQPLPDSTGSLQTLSSANTVYVRNTTMTGSYGYYLSQDGITIVIMPGATLKFLGSGANCGAAGTTSTPSWICGIFTNKSFTWLEGEYEGAGSLQYGFFGVDATRTLLRYFSMVRPATITQGMHCKGCSSSLVHKSRFDTLASGVTFDLNGTSATNYALISDSIFGGMESNAVMFSASSSYPSSGNGVIRTVIAGSGVNTIANTASGIYFYYNNNSFAHMVTFSQLNTVGIRFDFSNYVSVSQILGISNSSHLFFIDTSSGSPNNLRFANIMSWTPATPSSTNYVFNLDAAASGKTATQYGNLWHNHGSTYGSYTPDYASFTDGAGSSAGWTSTSSYSSLQNSIVGLASTDSVLGTANPSFSGTMQLVRLENAFRALLKDFALTATPVANKGRCNAGNCRVFDYRISQSDALVRNIVGQFTPGGSCPGSVSDTSFALQNVSTKYLYNAAEIVLDGVGNDNGLCESDEACVYQPNVGAYLGEGNLNSSPCNFTNGANFQNIKMYGFNQNGG